MKSRLNNASRYLIAAGLILLAAGSSVAAAALYENYQARYSLTQSVTSKTGGITTSTVGATYLPSTDIITPSAYERYTVDADLPRYILIPKIGVRAIVEQLGVTVNNQLESPSNIYQAGWYKNSSEPGQLGAMLIDGHVASWSTHGVFYSLSQLEPGDKLEVERGDGKIFNYEVVKTQVWNVADVDMDMVQKPFDSNRPGLNLITCTGSVLPGTSEFSQRLVVFTEQI